MYPDRKKLFAVIVLLIATAVLSLSADAKIENLTHTHYNYYIDLLQHSMYYLVLTITGCWLFPALKPWVVGLILFGLSLVLEILQHFMPQRSFSFHDIMSNLTGITVGTLLVLAFRSWGRKQQAARSFE